MKTIASLLLASGVALAALTGAAAASTGSSTAVPPAIVEIDQFAALHPVNSTQDAIEVDRTRDQALQAYQHGDTAKAEALVKFAHHQLGMPDA
jgi:hypothetical protein